MRPVVRSVFVPLFAAAVMTLASTAWVPPLGFPLEVSAPYVAPEHRYAAGHRGFDVRGAPGQRVLAPVSGEVIFAGRVVDRDVMTLKIDDGTLVSLEPLTARVRRGERVRAGQEVGILASGGHCKSRCLHLGVRVSGEYTNPMRFFRERPILLPW